MRAILAILCLFCGSPDDTSAEGFDAAQDSKVMKYRVLLSELSSLGAVPETRAPTDLPEGLKEAIEDWTRSEG